MQHPKSHHKGYLNMPWKAVGNKIVRSDTGKVVGKSSSHGMAIKAVKARYANMDPTEALNHNKPNGHKAGCQCKSCCVDE